MKINNSKGLLQSNRGMVLLLVLWAMGLLTVFTVNIGLRVREKVTLVARLERRSKLNALAEGGVRQALAIFFNEDKFIEEPSIQRTKAFRFNNPALFSDVSIGDGICYFGYKNYDYGLNNATSMFGYIDEERKLNINKANVEMMQRLFEDVLGYDEGDAEDLAQSIYDWREYGESEIEGFYSDAYYDNLEFPYKEKKSDFEVLEEILLVKGMDDEIYKQLQDFITIFGNGSVNINTAPKPILMALGISGLGVDQFISIRQGEDGQEATEDDVVFSSGEALAGMLEFEEDIQKADELLKTGILGVKSDFFRIQYLGTIKNSRAKKTIDCVFNGQNGKIVYWREK
ncbi:MAG: general secretion pathway protein GspK [Candidatus Omnitrophica bacterium]|nr:general secretion pathway protein GspK [Candidatus Omnitrophota bacterium]